MKEPAMNRTRYVGLRFTQEEFEKIEKKSLQSTTPQLSEFIRRCLFDKPITIRQRNQSLDDYMAELMRLRSELNAIGANLNQAVKQLHVFKNLSAVNAFLDSYPTDQQNLATKVDQIQSHINQLSDIWLQ